MLDVKTVLIFDILILNLSAFTQNAPGVNLRMNAQEASATARCHRKGTKADLADAKHRRVYQVPRL